MFSPFAATQPQPLSLPGSPRFCLGLSASPSVTQGRDSLFPPASHPCTMLAANCCGEEQCTHHPAAPQAGVLPALTSWLTHQPKHLGTVSSTTCTCGCCPPLPSDPWSPPALRALQPFPMRDSVVLQGGFPGSCQRPLIRDDHGVSNELVLHSPL